MRLAIVRKTMRDLACNKPSADQYRCKVLTAIWTDAITRHRTADQCGGIGMSKRYPKRLFMNDLLRNKIGLSALPESIGPVLGHRNAQSSLRPLPPRN